MAEGLSYILIQHPEGMDEELLAHDFKRLNIPLDVRTPVVLVLGIWNTGMV